MAKPLISADFIYATALEILTEEGLGALTARSLTARLHCSAKTLYQQVGNREQLLRGLVAYAFEQIEVDFAVGEDWQSSVVSWSLALRNTLCVRPDLGRLIAIGDRDVVVRYVNRLIKVLMTDGFPQELAIETGRVLSHATVSMTLADLAAPAEPDRPEFFTTAVRWLVAGIEDDLAARAR
ncbi:MAG: TetR family transcriptional regulator [Nocardioides sp.]|nr:TetR family transcriptional regulator [Nocardioides sp.]